MADVKPKPDFSDWPEFVLSPEEAAKYGKSVDTVNVCGIGPFSIAGSMFRSLLLDYFRATGCGSWFYATRKQREAAWDYVTRLLGYTEDC